MRWKIETFHKILKSGFKAEQIRLRTAERLTNMIALLTILSWRVFWMTMIGRTAPEELPHIAFTSAEMYLLGIVDRIMNTGTNYMSGGKHLGPKNQGGSVVNGVDQTPKAAVPQVPH